MWQCTRGAILLEREHALVGDTKCETSSQFNRLLLRHQCAYFHIREQSTKLCRAYVFKPWKSKGSSGFLCLLG